uniref:Bm8076 n=1 Tax=Brugia malayi TaxID=6279 RepID=A0A0H5S0I8_BRUMA|nr:Bm8076 [Brugia malayi]
MLSASEKNDSSLEIELNHAPPFLRFRNCGNCPGVFPADSVNICLSELSSSLSSVERNNDNASKLDVNFDRRALIDENVVDVAVDDELTINCNSTLDAPSVVPLSRKRNRRIWTLVSGDGHDFRCNACKRIIKCCSPTNITRHYANNHPEILKTGEISIDMTKESIEPIVENSAKDTMMTSNDMQVSNGTRMNTGKIDWSSPSIRKILEKIASRELTEKMGTDMIAYKTGCQLSQSTVRKRVHCLLEEKVFGDVIAR